VRHIFRRYLDLGSVRLADVSVERRIGPKRKPARRPENSSKPTASAKDPDRRGRRIPAPDRTALGETPTDNDVPIGDLPGCLARAEELGRRFETIDLSETQGRDRAGGGLGRRRDRHLVALRRDRRGGRRPDDDALRADERSPPGDRDEAGPSLGGHSIAKRSDFDQGPRPGRGTGGNA